MKTMRRLLCVLMALMLLVSAAALAEARSVVVNNEDSARLSIQSVSVANSGAMEMAVYGADGNLRDDNIALTVGGYSVPSSVASYNGPTTWVLLVDTASVGTDNGSEPVRDTLRSLVDSMGDADTAAIMRTGNGGGSLDFSGRDDLADELETLLKDDKLKIKSDKRNLYKTIQNAVNALEKKEVEGRKALVVISQGDTGDPVEKASSTRDVISDSSVTVYTIAYKNSKTDARSLLEYMSLAEASKGGFGLEMLGAKNADDASAMVSEIVDNEGRFFTVKADPAPAIKAELEAAKPTSYTLDGAVALSGPGDTSARWILDEAQIKAIDDHIEYENKREDPPPKKWWEKALDFAKENVLVIVLCAVILAAIIVIIVLMVQDAKRRKAEAPAPAPEPEGNDGPPDDPVGPANRGGTAPVNGGWVGGGNAGWGNNGGGNRGGTGVVTEVEEEPQVHVALTDVAGGSRSFEGVMRNGELTIGRKTSEVKEQSQLQIDNGDGKISRRHVLLRYNHGEMVAVDMSQNGTRLNGVEINRPAQLHQRDTLGMGRSEFLVTWWFR